MDSSTELTNAEIQVLAAVGMMQSQNQAADKSAVESFGQNYFGMYRTNWGDAFETLVAKQMLHLSDGRYTIAKPVRPLAERLRQENPKFKFFYDEFFTRARTSTAHARFCERVYGRNLCQHGMMDMEQLEFMLRMLALDSNARVLDLGCGNGMIAEYISDTTGAHVTGIDTSAVGIAHADERTRAKSARLTFMCGDMLQAEFVPHSIDVMIAIDTLGFVTDRERLLQRLRAFSEPEGRLAVFWSAWVGDDEPQDLLRADGTRVAQALAQCGLKFQAFDFKMQEIAHWKRKLQVVEELCAEFQAEGNEFLFERRQLEAKTHQTYVQAGNVSRYLYLAQF